MTFFNKKENRIHAALAILLSVINIYIIITLKPPNQAQGIFGNIFYIHVPIAWSAFLLYFAVMVCGIFFLIKKSIMGSSRISICRNWHNFYVFGINYWSNMG